MSASQDPSHKSPPGQRTPPPQNVPKIPPNKWRRLALLGLPSLATATLVWNFPPSELLAWYTTGPLPRVVGLGIAIAAGVALAIARILSARRIGLIERNLDQLASRLQSMRDQPATHVNERDEGPYEDCVPVDSDGRPSSVKAECHPFAGLDPVTDVKEAPDTRRPTQTKSPCNAIATTHQVHVAKDLLPQVSRYITEFLDEHGQDNEAGVMLIGSQVVDTATGGPITRVLGFIPAGPSADFSPSSIAFDAEYQEAALRAVQLLEPNIQCVGCLHRHPGDYDLCSVGDLETDREAVRSSGLPSMAFAIVTLGNRRRDPTSVYIDDLKFDFFVLGKGPDQQYVKVVPQIVASPLICVPEALVRLAQLRGPSITFDFKSLRSLPGVQRISVRSLRTSDGVAAAIQTRDQKSHADLLFIAKSDGAIEVIVTRDGQRPATLCGPWTAPGVGRHTWYTELALVARRLASRQDSACPQLGVHCSQTWWERDPKRLFLERRAMHELHGNRVTLHQKDNRLYWSATLHESGRSLGVFIVYPENYPSVEPYIESTKDLPVSPHTPVPGTRHFCWTPGTNSDWNPARDTAAVALAAASRWYACLLVYCTRGVWPKEADHPS